MELGVTEAAKTVHGISVPGFIFYGSVILFIRSFFLRYKIQFLYSSKFIQFKIYTVQNLYSSKFIQFKIYTVIFYTVKTNSKFIWFKIYTVQNLYGTKFILQKKV
jgi:hypothetical protein